MDNERERYENESLVSKENGAKKRTCLEKFNETKAGELYSKQAFLLTGFMENRLTLKNTYILYVQDP